MVTSVSDQFFEIGDNIVRKLEGRRSALEAELLEIEKRKTALQSQINRTQFARQRLADFSFKIGAHYQCPRCWIENEARSSLRPVPSDTKNDLFRCDACGLPVEIEMGV